MLILLLLILLLISIVLALATFQNAQANVLTAQAAIEAAKAAQIASIGQTMSTMTQNMIILLLIAALIASVGFCGWLYYKLRIKPILDERKQPSNPRWISGPNAHWQRLDEGSRPQSITSADPLQQLIQLEVLRMLRENRPTTALPARLQPSDEEDLKW